MCKEVLSIVLAALISAPGPAILRASKGTQPGTQEIGITLRIIQDGAALESLREQDVELLIDGAPQAISGWRNVKRRIGAPPASSPRSFVLVFHLHECPDNLGPALGKLFNDLLRDHDRLLVLANQGTLLIDDLTDRGKSAAFVEAFVKEQARRFRQTLEKERENLTKLIEKITSDYTRVTANIHRHYYMKGFKLSLDEYLTFLRKYKQRYLLPAPGLFAGLCPQLAGSSGEKWIIAFWQVSEIPKIPRKSRELIARVVTDFQESTMLDENDYGNLFKRWLIDAEDVFTGKSAFPSPGLYNFFAGFETTLHAFYVAPLDPSAEKDADFKRVAGQAQEILAGLAENSGGLFREFAEPASDMAAVADKTDSYYALSFRPASGYKKIKIHLPDKKLSAWFDPLRTGEREKECQAQINPREKQIELRDVAVQDRKLSFKIVHFFHDVAEKGSKNRVFARVFLKDGQDRKVFDQSKNFVPQKNEIAVRLDLPGVPAGGYVITIEVGDWLTGKTHIRILDAQLE